MLILNLFFLTSEAPSEEQNNQRWESEDRYDDSSVSSAVRGTLACYGTGHTEWMASLPLNLANHPTYVVLDLGCTRSIGSRTATRRLQKHAMYHGISTEACPCDKSFVFANFETGNCWESCIIHFLIIPSCSARVDVLETCNVPILFSLHQMHNLGNTLELDPKGNKITCPAFGLYSSPADYSTMGHIVLDLTSLAYQPKSRERSARWTKHVTLALSQRRSAYAAHTRELDEDEDEQPLVRSDGNADSEDEDDKPRVQLTSRKEPVEDKRESAAARRFPTQLRISKGCRAWQEPSAKLEQEVSGNSRERSEDISGLGKNSDGEALQKIINKLLDVRNFKDLHLKHYHMSAAQFKKRTTHLDIPGKVHDLYQRVVKTCPLCNSTKQRPDRSHVSGLRAEEFGDLIFLDHGSTKIEDQTFGFLIVLDGASCHLTAYQCKSTFASESFPCFMIGWTYFR